MQFIFLLHILVTKSASQYQIHFPKSLSLETFVSQQRNDEALTHLDRKSDIVLPNGRYHVSIYEITSTIMNLNGKQSKIVPSWTVNDEDSSHHSESNGFANAKKNTRNELFRISNSTVWMSELTFECGSAGSSIATIRGSCVRIGGSRVISNSDRTPFVIVGGDSGKSSSITIIACSHTSSCFPSLLPLTSLETSDVWTTHNQESSLGTEVSVTGSEISVCDACLIGGSGALFDFCGLGQTVTDGSSMTTTLSSSLLLNTTSSSGSGRVGVDVKEGGGDFGNCWSVSQKMIGSCASLCTNHLYGTGTRDLNLGGSVLCSNTSFTLCTTDYSNQHFTTQTTLSAANTIHTFSLCTFKACSSTSAGGAIDLYNVNSVLTIESCSFDSCSTMGNAGAIYYWQSSVRSSVTISSSSFVKCSATASAAGSLYLSKMQELAISGCMFLDSQTSEYGGAAYLVGWNAQNTIGFSNCLFRNCTTTKASGDGGTLYFDGCSSIRLDSLSFRERVTSTGKGLDLQFTAEYPTVSLSTVSNCDSTSTPKAGRIYPTDGVTGDPLPDPTGTTTVLSLIAQQTSSTTAEIVVTLDKTVTGSLLVLVSNSEGTAQPTGKAPNIGRVLLFPIQSLDTGQYTASIGEIGLLQLPLEDYKVVTASLPKYSVSFSDVSLERDETLTLTSAKCVLDNSHTHAVLNLEGFNLEGETFVLTLQNERTLYASFSEYEATIDLGLIGESSGWMEKEEFEIKRATKKDDDSIIVSITSPLSFTIPSPARLTNIEVSELNEAQTEVTLSFSSQYLKVNQDYEIAMKRKDGSGEVVMNVTTDDSGLLADQTVKLYPSKENMEEWKNSIGFEDEYEVIGVSAKIGEKEFPTLFSPILLKMPTEPARVIGIWGSLDESGNTTSITLRGRQIPKGLYTVRLNSESGPSFEISFPDELSEERNSSVSSVSIFGVSTVLSFDTTYTLFSVIPTSSASGYLIIDANPNSFRITEPARIIGVTIGDFSDTQKTEATLTMTGRALTPNTDYEMHLTGLPKTTSSTAANTEADVRTITMRTDSSITSESVSKTIEFYPHASAELLFGYEYEVDSASLDGAPILRNAGLSFSTPNEPARLSSIESCSLTPSKDGVVVIVKGFALKQDTTLMIVKSSGGDEFESDGEIDVKTGSECWISFKVGWEENTTHLEFLKTYTLVGGSGGSNELIITPDLSFTVPSGPIIKQISVPLDCASSSFPVGIVGTGLPIETGFIVELVGGLSFLVDFKSATTGNGTISASLPGQIQFNNYSVKSVMKDDRKMKCDSVSFRTPLGPTLKDVNAELNASNINNVILTLESVRMPVGEMTLTVQEDSSIPIALTVSFVSSEEGSVEVVVFRGSTLKYGTTYTVVSLTSSSLHCSLDGLITFETPATPPRIKTASCSLVGELKRDGEIVLSGEALPAGTPFSISVDEIDENGDVIPYTIPISLSDTFGGVIGDAALTTHTLSIALFPVPQLMKYSSRYRITSMSIPTVPTAVEETAVFRFPDEPARIVGIWGKLDGSGNTTSTTLRGRQIPKGLYTVKLNSESGPSFEISFPDELSEERNSSISSVSIFGLSAVLSFDTAYTLFSVTPLSSPSMSLLIDANPRSFVISEPSRITGVDISEISSPQKDSVTLTVTGRALKASTTYTLKVRGEPIPTSSKSNSDSHTTTLSVLSTSSSLSESASCLVVLYPLSSADLRYGHSYSIDWMKEGSTEILRNADISFETPDEPARIDSFVSCSLDGSIFVKRSGEAVPFEGVVTVSEATECLGVFSVGENEDTTRLAFGKTYSLQSASSGSTPFVIDSGVSFVVPHPPVITSIECVFVNSLQNLCRIQLKGTDFVVGTEYEVTLNNTVRLGVRMKTSTEGESEGVSIGKNGKLEHNTTYTLTEVTPIREEDGVILVLGTLSLTTKERSVMEVIVREGGSDEISECGTIGNACESVLVGWRAGEKEEVSGVVVKIDGRVGFGGRVVVGEKNVEIGGLFEGENELKVSVGDLPEDGEDGVVSVSGGRVVIVGIRLILPSGWEMGAKRVGSVVSGFGECVLRSLSIVSGWKDEGAGMGLVSWMGGSLSVEQIVMEGVEMESGVVLVNCSSIQKEVSLELESSRFIGVGTRNVELVRFSSKSEESHFSMRDCVFVSTERIESGEVGDGMGVIVVSTWQEKTTIVNCMFSESGTVVGRRGSWKKGGVLIVEVGSSNVKDRKEVELFGNVFVDSSVVWEGNEVEKRGGVAVWSVGVGQTKIDLCGSWFEETGVSGVVLDRDSFGVPVLEKKRKIAHSLSDSGHAGLVVVVGRMLPVIRRVGSSFSGCSLRMVSDDAGPSPQRNADEL
ncbi:hypothetical protein BLNAU_14193 [Blattamonas nauphoetae]|uniref:Uncharacterized protein n=1 Tax=Blattamonas nauphoetae TaxID=2049346 RepID=A0ABQ9XKV7_9EUKA|nr:hypothetical protein BLNAU_14193 [Blattamonas nauphoetae]